jgi:hypothetical protein
LPSILSLHLAGITAIPREPQIFSILKVKTWDEAYALFGDKGKYKGMWGILDILRMADDGDRLTAVVGTGVDENGYYKDLTKKLGTFTFKDGELYFKNGEELTLALPVLSSGEYDHTRLTQHVPILNADSDTETYIQQSSTRETLRYDPSQLDQTAVGLDIFGLGLSFFGASSLAKGANVARSVQGFSYGVGAVSASRSLAVK